MNITKTVGLALATASTLAVVLAAAPIGSIAAAADDAVSAVAQERVALGRGGAERVGSAAESQHGSRLDVPRLQEQGCAEGV
jgi:hypothetical protein